MSNTKFVTGSSEAFDSVGFNGKSGVVIIKPQGMTQIELDQNGEYALYLEKDDIDLLILALEEYKKL